MSLTELIRAYSVRQKFPFQYFRSSDFFRFFYFRYPLEIHISCVAVGSKTLIHGPSIHSHYYLSILNKTNLLIYVFITAQAGYTSTHSSHPSYTNQPMGGLVPPLVLPPGSTSYNSGTMTGEIGA